MDASNSGSDNAAAHSVIASSVTTLSLAGIAVGLRFISRGYVLRFLGSEDWTIAAALLFSVGNTVGMVLQAEYALGQHMRDLSVPQITEFLKAAWYTIIFYNISLTLTKISVLLLFLKIFKTNGRRAVYAIIAVVAIYGLWCLLSGIFFCRPVAAFWDITITNAVCLSKEAIWFTNASLNIVTDFMIFILPIPVLIRLNLGRKKKIGLIAVFAVGFFVCMVSVLRLYSLYLASISTDPTWDNIGVATWSSIELNTAIVCACLTTLKPLLARIFPRLFSTSKATSNGYINHSSGIDAVPGPTMPNKTKHTMAIDSESQRYIVSRNNGSIELSDFDSR